MAPSVADAGPLHYLVLIGHIGLLPDLFGRVVAPAAVGAELMRPQTPRSVRDWIAAPAAWFALLPDPAGAEALPVRLDPGERAAIALAETLSATSLLSDDRAARAVASARGLDVVGTLGILGRGARRGLLDLPAAVARLRATNFRHRPQMLDDLLARHRQGDEG